MSALSANRNTRPLMGIDPVDEFTVVDADILYAGGIMAIDSSLELKPAADTLGQRVVGICQLKTDNTDDGEKAEVKRGIIRLGNSTSYAITRAMIGEPCYVEDDQTVGSGSSNLVVAGLVHDVDSTGVWVDMRPEALATARRMARPKVVSITDATKTISAAQVFQGNVVLACDKNGGVTLTLPTAVAGYRIGVQRIAATAAHDVVITAASGDTVRGSDAAGTITNDTDAVSGVLWLETENATNWTDAMPLAKDRAEWEASS